jgi:glyoxylase-like metal-dependent hydrolase (beta-lactamase superfamily II)
VERVRDGIWSLPVPMPGSGVRYLLAYALELPDGLALIDTGWPSEQAWQGLLAGLDAIGYRPEQVRAVLATHVHTDHYGLAGRLRDASGAWVGLHRQDALVSTSENPQDQIRSGIAAWREQRKRMGMPETASSGTQAPQPRAWHQTALVRPDMLIGDGDLLELPGWRLRAIWTPGHTPGHLCFHEENLALLFGGDHVLPKVTPSVAVTSRQREDPLGDFLASQAAVATLPAAEVLPAHEYRYTGLRERALSIVAHHEARLAEIQCFLAAHPGATCWEVTTSLRWSRPLESQPAALRRTAARETLAHLVHLQARGLARVAGDTPQRWHAGPAA